MKASIAMTVAVVALTMTMPGHVRRPCPCGTNNAPTLPVRLGLPG